MKKSYQLPVTSYQLKCGGFTLVELLIVIGLIGLLTTASIASYTNTLRTSRDARRKSDVEQIRSALELYRSDNSAYPNLTGSTETYLKTPLTSPVPYISANSFPKDPQNSTGQYYYYARVSATTYNICARLEATPAPAEACPGSYDCSSANGTQACNYGLTQP